MWYLKFTLKHKDCLISPLVEKYHLCVEFYPLGHYVRGSSVFVSAVHKVTGEEKNIKRYISSLRKEKRMVKVEVSPVIFTLSREPSSLGTYQAMYDPRLFYVTPGFYSDGKEGWEIACWERRPLEKLITILKHARTTTFFEILRFEEKMGSVSK